MFDRIAHRYDLLNDLMTFGLHRRWKRDLVSDLPSGDGCWILDIGAGTGDLSLRLADERPETSITACDRSWSMIQRGSRRENSGNVFWIVAEAARLPFPPSTFQSAMAGFLLRNLDSLDPFLDDVHALLQSGGSLHILEGVPPAAGPFRWVISLYLRFWLPWLGWVFAGDRAAYAYLGQSIVGFHHPEELKARLQGAGFHQIRYTTTALGTILRLTANRPDANGP